MPRRDDARWSVTCTKSLPALAWFGAAVTACVADAPRDAARDTAVDSGDSGASASDVGVDVAVDAADAGEVVDTGTPDAGTFDGWGLDYACSAARLCPRLALPEERFNLGPAGYMGSTQTSCSSARGPISGRSLVAKEFGIFLLTGAGVYNIEPDPSVSLNPGLSLQKFSSGAWEELAFDVEAGYWTPSSVLNMAVTDDESAFVYNGSCGSGELFPGIFSCWSSGRSTVWWGLPAPFDMSSAANRVFAVDDDGIVERVGGVYYPYFRRPVGRSGAVSGYWTDGNHSIMVGLDQLLLLRDETTGIISEPVSVPADNFYTLNVRNSDDFYVRGALSTYHYRNGTLSPMNLVAPTECPSGHMYANDAALVFTESGTDYYRTPNEFGRFVDGAFERIWTIPCGQKDAYIADVEVQPGTGHVFVMVAVDWQDFYECGPTHLLVYDGEFVREF